MGDIQLILKQILLGRGKAGSARGRMNQLARLSLTFCSIRLVPY